MHADDTNYAVIKNGIVVVSGTGPAIRVVDNQLVIRDGPLETPPLALTRAEASRRLRHMVVCGQAGGFVTFDALRWLRDTGVAFTQLDWDGAVIMSSGPLGPDQPALRRAQALVCSGAVPNAAVAITREILRLKLNGQAEVARLMGSAETGAAIDDRAEAIGRETDGIKILNIEASAAAIYWKQWETLPVRFARRNPQRLGSNGKWRPGRPDAWLTFGPRSSLLSGKPQHASTPANALLNYLYGVLKGEMTVALLGVGLDPGIGMFHSDIDRRASLALDAMEAVRPYVDYWLLEYLSSSVFANRDFAELGDGEVRLTHPLSAHLAHTAALWRKACERVADWLARGFSRASGGAEIRPAFTLPAGRSSEVKSMPHRPLSLPSFTASGRGLRLPALAGLRSGLRADPVPLMCGECGKAVRSRRRIFCGDGCEENYRWAMGKHRPVVAGLTRASYGRHRDATLAGQRAAQILPAADREALRRWYEAELQPRLAHMSTTEVARGAAMGRTYAHYIIVGKRIPHPRHYPNLAALAGIELPGKFGAVLAASNDW